MKKLLTAIALTIALPALAYARTAPADAPMAHAGHDMQRMNCKDMHGTTASGHAGHQPSPGSAKADHMKMDHSKMDHMKMAGCSDANKAGAMRAPAGRPANHQR